MLSRWRSLLAVAVLSCGVRAEIVISLPPSQGGCIPSPVDISWTGGSPLSLYKVIIDGRLSMPNEARWHGPLEPSTHTIEVFQGLESGSTARFTVCGKADPGGSGNEATPATVNTNPQGSPTGAAAIEATDDSAQTTTTSTTPVADAPSPKPATDNNGNDIKTITSTVVATEQDGSTPTPATSPTAEAHDAQATVPAGSSYSSSATSTDSASTSEGSTSHDPSATATSGTNPSPAMSPDASGHMPTVSFVAGTQSIAPSIIYVSGTAVQVFPSSSGSGQPNSKSDSQKGSNAVGLNSGAIAGIVVGAVLGGAALMAVVILCVKRSRKPTPSDADLDAFVPRRGPPSFLSSVSDWELHAGEMAEPDMATAANAPMASTVYSQEHARAPSSAGFAGAGAYGGVQGYGATHGYQYGAAHGGYNDYGASEGYLPEKAGGYGYGASEGYPPEKGAYYEQQHAGPSSYNMFGNNAEAGPSNAEAGPSNTSGSSNLLSVNAEAGPSNSRGYDYGDVPLSPGGHQSSS